MSFFLGFYLSLTSKQEIIHKQIQPSLSSNYYPLRAFQSPTEKILFLL